MSADLHTYEVTAGWAMVYAQPTTFSPNRGRVTRGMRMQGREMRQGSKVWVEIVGSGYILASRVRVVDMDGAIWLAFLDTLTPVQLHLVQGIMARVQTIMNKNSTVEVE